MKPFIPLYSYPGTAKTAATDPWRGLLTGHRDSHVVVNVANGPGDAIDPRYQRAIAAAAPATETLYGYVYLDYGKRPAGDVLADFQRWRQFYGLAHIFLDECPIDQALMPSLVDLIEQLRAEGAVTVVVNPGVYPAATLWDACDLVVTRELAAMDYLALDLAAEPGPYERSIHLIHSCPPKLLSQVNRRLTHVGYGLVTIHGQPHPWRDLGVLDDLASTTNR